MKTKSIIILLFSLVLSLGCFALTGCDNSKGEYAITVEQSDYGTVFTKGRANAGDCVKLNVFKTNGVGKYVVYVNGKAIEGNEFIMPESDVVLNVSYYSQDAEAHDVIIENNQDGVVVASLSSALKGQVVTLNAYSVYNRQIDYYTINGQRVLGNSFNMPDEDVVVEGVFKEVYSYTNVKLSATAAYQKATSYWFAEYSQYGVTIQIVTEDNLIFTGKKGYNSVGMMDNVEFIIGNKTTNSSFNNTTYKMLVNAEGDYFWQRYDKSFKTIYDEDIYVNVEPCKVFTHGFLGYKTTVAIPYESLGLTYNTGYGNIVICPAMRNTTNDHFTTWVSYSGMQCKWNSPATHLIIEKDGSFVSNVGKAQYLYTGDELLSSVGGTYLLNSFNGSYTYTVKGSKLSYWTKNIEDILKYDPEEVFFACGVNDLEENTVLQTFVDLKEFIRVFQSKTEAKLSLVSSVPSIVSKDPLAVIAYNGMVKEFAKTLENVEYIDVCQYAFDGQKINTSYYSSEKSLSEEGNLLLAKEILVAKNEYKDNWTGDWGSTDKFFALGSWTETDGTVRLNDGGTSNIYYKGGEYSDFVFETSITASAIYNGDPYPKFGMTLSNGSHIRYYYVSAVDLTEKIVGMVEKPYTGFDWSGSVEETVADLVYSSQTYAKLKIVKLDQAVYFYVNDKLVITSSAEKFKNDDITLGLFSFNIGMTVKDIRIETDLNKVREEVM